MLMWLTLPFYDFCGFRSVAVNSVYKLQFFTFIVLTLTMKVFLWLKIWRTSAKGRCHSNQLCGIKRRQVGIKRFYCLCWNFTAVQKIAKPKPIVL